MRAGGRSTPHGFRVGLSDCEDVGARENFMSEFNFPGANLPSNEFAILVQVATAYIRHNSQSIIQVGEKRMSVRQGPSMRLWNIWHGIDQPTTREKVESDREQRLGFRDSEHLVV